VKQLANDVVKLNNYCSTDEDTVLAYSDQMKELQEAFDNAEATAQLLNSREDCLEWEHTPVNGLQMVMNQFLPYPSELVILCHDVGGT